MYTQYNELLGKYVDVPQNHSQDGASIAVVVAAEEAPRERTSDHYPMQPALVTDLWSGLIETQVPCLPCSRFQAYSPHPAWATVHLYLVEPLCTVLM